MKFFEILDAIRETGLKVLNPGVTLDREVTGIDLSETPDVYDYVAPNTLLITTAMLYRDEPAKLTWLIEKLRDAGVAGIAIKLGRFLAAVEPETLERAKELDFVVLQIPMETTLGVVAHKLQSLLLGEETRQMHYALDIQKEISRLLHRNAPLEDLLHSFSNMLRQNVGLFDFFFDIESMGSLYSTPLGRKKMEKIGAALKRLYREQPITETDEFILSFDKEEYACIVAPIDAGSGYPFFLVIACTGTMPELFSYVVTESAASVFSFAIHKNQQFLAQEWISREETFRKLLNRKEAITINDLRVFSEDFSGQGPCLLVAIGFIKGGLPAKLQGRDNYALVYAWIQKKIAQLGKNVIFVQIVSRERFVLLISEQSVRLRPFLSEIADGLREYLPLQLKFGVSNQMLEVETLPFAFIQASRALSVAIEDAEGDAIQFYHSEGAKELFQFVPPEHARHFCLHILKELAYPEGEYNQELRRTLEMFLNCQSDIGATAKRLHIHRNTVKYRMERVEHMLETPLDAPDNSLNLRLAILLSKYDPVSSKRAPHANRCS